MRVGSLLLAVALGAGSVSAVASPFSDAADLLNGEWRGGEFVLRVDAKRAQASVDAERPFSWERFLVKDVNEEAIVFAIGAELYEAKLGPDMLTLTGTSFRGERVLMRETGLRGTSE
jgi:hypothetical protein